MIEYIQLSKRINEEVAINWKSAKRYAGYLKAVANKFKLGTGYSEYKIRGVEQFVIKFGPSTNPLIKSKYTYLGIDFQSSGRSKFGWINSFAVSDIDYSSGFSLSGKVFKLPNGADFKPIPKDFVKMEHVLSLIVGVGADFDNDKTKITPAALIKDDGKSSFNINQRFAIMSKLVRMIANKALPGMIIVGTGGLGKTYEVVRTLTTCGLLEDDDYIHFRGAKLTTTTFYKTLFDNSNKLLIFDDSDSVLDSDDRINMLKSALDSTGDERYVQYVSPAIEAMDLPTKFEFTGQIIFISNRAMKDISQPIISRSLSVDVTMNLAETFERMRFIVESEKDPEEKKFKEMALLALQDYSKKTNGTRPKDLNMRTLFKLSRIYKNAESPEDTEDLVEYTMSVS